MSENSSPNRLFYMPRHAQETDIIHQRKTDEATRVALEEMARQGRIKVSSRHQEPARKPSTCRLIEGRPRSNLAPYPRQPGEKIPSEDRVASRARADAIAEVEQRAAIDRSWPFFRVAAIRATPKELPRRESPDHYGLRAHIEESRRRISPAESPPRWPLSYGGD